MVVRKRKKRNFTTLDNDIFKNKDLSMKAKGLLCTLLSLPDDWEYSIGGLAALSKDGKASIRSTLNELEEMGYFTREKRRVNGQFKGYDYIIYEEPVSPDTMSSEPTSGKATSVECTQLNTNQLNTKELNTNSIKPPVSPKGGKKIPPTIEEVREYAQSRGNIVDPDYFFDYYEGLNWMRGKTKVKDWQATYRTWERRADAGSKGTETGKSDTSGNGIDYNQFVDVC
jgi:hypothetical protein